MVLPDGSVNVSASSAALDEAAVDFWSTGPRGAAGVDDDEGLLGSAVSRCLPGFNVIEVGDGDKVGDMVLSGKAPKNPRRRDSASWL